MKKSPTLFLNLFLVNFYAPFVLIFVFYTSECFCGVFAPQFSHLVLVAMET